MNRTAAPVDDGRCVGCGPDSPSGLHMRFAREADGSVTSRLVVPAMYQGWRGVVHGGVVALMLDEAMAYAAAAAGWLGVTAELGLRFRSEVNVDHPIVVRGRVRWQRRSVIAVEADVRAQDGTLLASGDGKFITRGPVEPGTRLGFVAAGDAGR